MAHKQLELPDMPAPVTVAKRKDTRWYYIVSTTGRTMLALEDGKEVWIEHDTLNLAPMFFTSAATAHKYRRRYLTYGNVKLWPYQEPKPGRWRNTLAR